TSANSGKRQGGRKQAPQASLERVMIIPAQSGKPLAGRESEARRKPLPAELFTHLRSAPRDARVVHVLIKHRRRVDRSWSRQHECPQPRGTRGAIRDQTARESYAPNSA